MDAWLSYCAIGVLLEWHCAVAEESNTNVPTPQCVL
jgi:hypothetical protein